MKEPDLTQRLRLMPDVRNPKAIIYDFLDMAVTP
jgi:hypothetical protein